MKPSDIVGMWPVGGRMGARVSGSECARVRPERGAPRPCTTSEDPELPPPDPWQALTLLRLPAPTRRDRPPTARSSTSPLRMRAASQRLGGTYDDIAWEKITQQAGFAESTGARVLE